SAASNSKVAARLRQTGERVAVREQIEQEARAAREAAARLNDGAVADAVGATASLEPLEREIDTRTLGNGLVVNERRIPIGTVGANFEARPNVALDVA